MEANLLPVLSNLGIGGFSIYIMWRMFDANSKEREKHISSAQLEREKYIAIVTDTHKNFNEYQQRVQQDVMEQLSKNTEVLSKNADALSRVLNHFSK